MRVNTTLLSLLVLLTLCSDTITKALSPTTTKKKAVVVGGGPAGLASALILARHHNYHVTILEKSPISTLTEYQRSKSYFYNINERGQTLTKRFPALQQQIVKHGVGITRFERINVPADPKKLFDPKPFSRPQTPEERRKFGTFYWVPRHVLVQLFLDEVGRLEDDNIELCTGASCRNIQACSDGTLQVTATTTKTTTGSNNDNDNDDDDNGDETTTITLDANLVVGADGVNSKVQQILASKDEKNSLAADKWGSTSGYKPNDFTLVQHESPSTGLRIKTLQLKPNFTIPVGDGTYEPLNTTANYAIESVNKGRTNQISMILLPTRNATAVRPIAICTLPNHDVWKMDNGRDMKAWFQKAFPRFDFDDLVEENEWEAFAQSPGTRFPLCQYCPRASAYDNTKSHKNNSNTTAGIVLVGDALHAFPPDLGQGVNAALADVAVLDDCLANNNNSSVSEALDRYRSIIEPETKALLQLARVGAPFQYRQSSFLLIVRRYLWTANILFRIVLNKVTRGLTPQPAVMQMMDSQLSFSTIMKRANRFSVFLWSSLLSAAAALIL